MGTSITQDTSSKLIIKSNYVILRWFRDYATKVWAKYRETTRSLEHLGLKTQKETVVIIIQGTGRCVENTTRHSI